MAPDPGLSDAGFQLTSGRSGLPSPATCLSMCCAGFGPVQWMSPRVVGGWPEPSVLSLLPPPQAAQSPALSPGALCSESAAFVALIRGFLLQTSKLQLTWAACNPLAKL